MSDLQNKQVVPPLTPEAISAATQSCHQQLHESRQKIVSLYELFLRTSAAYYTMCDLDTSAPAGGSELLLAMSEFYRRGFIRFTDNSIEQLSKDYVQVLKMLKQVIDDAVATCDRLAMLTSAQRAAQRIAPPAQTPSDTPRPAYQSLDEALEAELNAENE